MTVVAPSSGAPMRKAVATLVNGAPLADPNPLNNTAVITTQIGQPSTTTDIQTVGAAQNGGPTFCVCGRPRPITVAVRHHTTSATRGPQKCLSTGRLSSSRQPGGLDFFAHEWPGALHFHL